MKENSNTMSFKKGYLTMKKLAFIAALAATLVFVFAATAMASGTVPNRSSSGVLMKPSAVFDVGTNNNVSYIRWPSAVSDPTPAVGTLRGIAQTQAWGGDAASIHAGYSIDTVKCQVCHSAHKAGITGTKLLPSGANGCLVCHSVASNFVTATKVATDSGGRHGADTQCTNGYCHATSPHGLDIGTAISSADLENITGAAYTALAAKATASLSAYPAAKVNMLNAKADSLIAAAIASNGTTPQPGYVIGYAGNAGLDAPGGTFKYMVQNPVTAAMMNDTTQSGYLAANPTAADSSLTNVGAAVATGYICTNNACHTNGCFNALDANAFFGAPTATAGFPAPAWVDPGTPSTANYGPRTQGIKGHRINAAVTTAYKNIAGTVVDGGQVAWAPAADCRSCHDQKDPRAQGPGANLINSFPHGQGRAFATTPDASKPDWLAGNTATSISSVWFTVAPYAGGPVEVTTKVAAAGVHNVASDGACLKCHRGTDPNGATPTGVGFNF